ncbi:hypothetical protein J5N97_001122 [Dioscorea zingiberensis]|uniref:ATP-dependent Clp protease proteolytic subunit n=1 Tax=Dioscorea zingiberensis TaxID=325984 RepID=A0A9D5BW16_9LILI|nr:hypothetical protein J5N97_001122 [Dioscorea zingiberensis]
MEAVVSAPRLLTGALWFQRFTKSPPSFLSLRTSLRSSISDGRSVSRPSSRTAAISSIALMNRVEFVLDGQKLGNELEALGVYYVMRYIEAPISTLCIGKAWGEAAIILAAGDRGSHYALPSSSIMIRCHSLLLVYELHYLVQPVANFDGQSIQENLQNRLNKMSTMPNLPTISFSSTLVSEPAVQYHSVA